MVVGRDLEMLRNALFLYGASNDAIQRLQPRPLS